MAIESGEEPTMEHIENPSEVLIQNNEVIENLPANEEPLLIIEAGKIK